MINKFESIEQVVECQLWAPWARTKETSLLHFIHQTSNKNVITFVPLPSNAERRATPRTWCDLTTIPTRKNITLELEWPTGPRRGILKNVSLRLPWPGWATLRRKRPSIARFAARLRKISQRCSCKFYACSRSKNNTLGQEAIFLGG